MKKNLFVFVALFIALIPLFSFLLWFFKPEQNMNIFILDKTVLTDKVQEHISLSWVLNNEQYVHSEKGSYDPQKDYFGFFPDGKGNYEVNDIEKYTDSQIDSLSDVYDIAYFTDSYGIYHIEWISEYHPELLKDERDIANRSKRYYGGLTKTELDFLIQMKAKKKLIINEFNIIASPTSKFVREKYEDEFGLRWTGWVGRYYDNLDTLVNKEIPRWLIENYKNMNNMQWPFTKSGIAFVREDDKVVILENETHLKVEVPYIHTAKEESRKYGIIKKIKYPFWFDIVKQDSNLQVISHYKIEPNLVGDSIMKAWKIPKTFPALVHSNQDYSYFYLAGDFCDNPISMTSSYFRYIELFSFINRSENIGERKSFFWDYYRPLMKNILKQEKKTNHLE